MKRYLYLSLMPEALIASMLPPEEFGNYLAVGTKKRTRGQAMFFEVDMDKVGNDFPLDIIDERCIEQPDGSPKRSVYLGIYRVLERVPLDALKQLYLVTDDGRVLGLDKEEYNTEDKNSLHLYQQLSPVTPRIASIYNPIDFMNFVTDTSKPVSVPKLVFVEMELHELGTDPIAGSTDDIPYQNIPHLRDCLVGLQESRDKKAKTVIRFFQGDLLYRTCKNGFFVGEHGKIFYYPFPSIEELEGKYYPWWRSALTLHF